MAARAAMVVRLGYPVDEQHYFSGFVLLPEDRAQWADIGEAADSARRAGVARAFIWALPQVARDGFVTFDEQGGDEQGGAEQAGDDKGGAGEADVQAFVAGHFPLAIGREAVVGATFS